MFPIAPHFIPCPLPSGVLSDSFGDEVCHFEKNIFKKKFCHKFPILKRKFKIFQKIKEICQKLSQLLTT
jgi:hypothetical protein